MSQENVWANIQKDEAPIFLRYDFEDKKKWTPFITPKIKKATFGKNALIQNQHVQYGAPAVQYLRPLDNQVNI